VLFPIVGACKNTVWLPCTGLHEYVGRILRPGAASLYSGGGEISHLRRRDLTWLPPQTSSDVSSERERYRMIFWSEAAFDLTYQWVKEGMTVPPDELADYCNAAVFPR